MKYSDLLEEIKERIANHNVHLEIMDCDGSFKALAFPNGNLIVINKRRIPRVEIPIVILHEYAHLIQGTSCSAYKHEYCNRITSESQANILAIEILLSMCDFKWLDYNSLGMLASCFHIPDILLPDVKRIATKRHKNI